MRRIGARSDVLTKIASKTTAPGSRTRRFLAQVLFPEPCAPTRTYSFAPGSAADIPIDEAYAKLGSEAAASKILRDRYSP